MIKRIVLTVICTLIFGFSVKAQQEYYEQLDKLDYNTLYSRFEQYYKELDSFQATRYANAYFNKAQKQKDTSQIAKGYYYRAILDKKNERVDLYDSIIALAPTLKKDNFPAKAHLQKGYYYFYMNQYDKALDSYISSSNYNIGPNKKNLSFDINLAISELKIRIEENQEALDSLKKYWKKAEALNYKNKKPIIYNRILFNLANAYRKSHQIDSSNTYIELGIQANNSLSRDKNNYYYYFLLLQAINELNSNYTKEITPKMDTVLDYMNHIDYKQYKSLAYYYIGKSHLEHNNKELATSYFLKVDSLVRNPASILPETLEGYKYLKKHYKEKDSYKNELKYLKKIYVFDSILDINYKSINSTIRNKYELPILLDNHKKTIETLDSQNQKTKITLILLSILMGVTLLFLTYSLVQKNKYKKRFKLLQEQGIPKTPKIKNSKEKPAIPDKIITKTKEYLELFEKGEDYLDHTINAEKMAELIGTNRPYFSKAFNYLNNESFNVYLRNLRLTYALERLRVDKTFRKYTIRTIADESGFSNPESFSKFFYKKYGIYPSYFIKSLEKQK
ncbi:AraC family transcriptional regulator [uncultured Dokdonia sp.]|uniref:helix-turn-helix domain-containing protein n=1 Tax=uncultured Dokdonia sp. TaxID=575653 RepID=UPI00261DDD94|nr:AraC family transcriptional regulator [uncultured Dokdonia sp.]